MNWNRKQKEWLKAAVSGGITAFAMWAVVLFMIFFPQ